MTLTPKTVVIIGAGYGGMALANLLAKHGCTVHVFEKNAPPGGRIHAIKKDGFTFDLGPSWYLMPEVFSQYYELFDLDVAARLDLIRFTPGYQVFFENHSPIRIQGDTALDEATVEQLEPGAGAAFRKYTTRSTTAYTLAVKHFLYNNFSRLRDVLKWEIVRSAPSMLSLVFQTLDSYVSKQFRSLQVKQLLEYHMVFLGSSPFQAPALYSLMSHLDFKSGVYYPKLGMLALADDLYEIGKQLGVIYHFAAPVERIVVQDGVATGVKCVDGSTYTADCVVSNADLHFTETQLLARDHQSFPERYWKKRQPGPGALLISLGIKGSLPSLLHHNLYFVENWRENFADIYETKRVPEHASIYICNPTKTDPALAPSGHENIFVLMPLPAGVDIAADMQQQLMERIIATLGRVVDNPQLKKRVVSAHMFGPQDFSRTFNAWQSNAFGGESHLLKQSVIFRTPNKSRTVKHLYYVGAGTTPGIGLPMCLISAALTYKTMFGIKQSGPLRRDDI